MTEYLRMTTYCVYLRILRSFLEHLFYRVPLGNCLFHVQVTGIQPPDTVKNKQSASIQPVITTRIYVLHKITIALKFVLHKF